MYYMLFCCGVIFLLAVIIGFRRGLLGSLLRVVSLIIAVVATMVFAPMVVDLLYEKTDLDERIEKKIYTEIEAGIQRQVADQLEAAGVDSKDIPALTAEETKYILGEGTDRATQMEMTSNMKIPEIFKNRLMENNTDKIYNKLGVSNFYEYAASYMTRTIMNIVGNSVTFFGIWVILLIICLISLPTKVIGAYFIITLEIRRSLYISWSSLTLRFVEMITGLSRFIRPLMIS